MNRIRITTVFFLAFHCASQRPLTIKPLRE